MDLFGSLAALVGIQADALKERIGRRAALYGALALLVTIAGVFLLVAAYVALSARLGGMWSALVIAGIALAIALVVWGWATLAERARARQAALVRRTTETTSLATTAALAALPMLIRNPAVRVLALPAAVVVGYMLLRRPNGPRPPAD